MTAGASEVEAAAASVVWTAGASRARAGTPWEDSDSSVGAGVAAAAKRGAAVEGRVDLRAALTAGAFGSPWNNSDGNSSNGADKTRQGRRGVDRGRIGAEFRGPSWFQRCRGLQ